MSERLDLLIIEKPASGKDGVKSDDGFIRGHCGNAGGPKFGGLCASHIDSPRAGFDNRTMTEAGGANNPVSGDAA